MNKQRFTKVLREPGKLKDELVELKELQEAYPYAQSIHVLIAILYKQKDLNGAASALNYAALYVADRHNLRMLMDNGLEPRPETSVIDDETESPTADVKQISEPVIEKKAEIKKEVAEKKSTDATSEEQNTSTHVNNTPPEQKTPKTITNTLPGIKTGDEMRADLLKNLESLQASKREWNGEPAAENKESTIKESKKHLKPAPEKKKLTSKSTAKGKEQTTSTKKSAKDAKKSKKTESPAKIKKQQELITKFIEISPSIKAKANNPPIISSQQEDLSVESTSFSDGLISENLADIMINQGKLDKAIDIYKKLIWKFPQKKAYFAARIEELTKQKG